MNTRAIAQWAAAHNVPRQFTDAIDAGENVWDVSERYNIWDCPLLRRSIRSGDTFKVEDDTTTTHFFIVESPQTMRVRFLYTASQLRRLGVDVPDFAPRMGSPFLYDSNHIETDVHGIETWRPFTHRYTLGHVNLDANDDDVGNVQYNRSLVASEFTTTLLNRGGREMLYLISAIQSNTPLTIESNAVPERGTVTCGLCSKNVYKHYKCDWFYLGPKCFEALQLARLLNNNDDDDDVAFNTTVDNVLEFMKDGQDISMHTDNLLK